MTDSRRYFLAGYLSAVHGLNDRHPEQLLPLADKIIAVLAELDVDELDVESRSVLANLDGNTAQDVGEDEER